MNYLEKAKQISNEIIEARRTIHEIAEVGFDLPKTVDYVMAKLKEYGYNPQKIGKAGVTCTVGKGGKTFLIRADMDALPMREESGLPFAATNGNCHSCGHDCHTAMLLGAAKMLKENEANLKGTVKLMFQPAEELLSGAKDIIEAGILENPTVDAALALHIMLGMNNSDAGTIHCCKGVATNSGDTLTINIIGKDAHGSMPDKGIDAINIAAHTAIALQEITSREIPTSQDSIVLVGKISGGTSSNSVAGSAKLEVSVRTCGVEEQKFLVKRVKEVAESVATTFRGTATITHDFTTFPTINNDSIVEQVMEYSKEIMPENMIVPMPKLGGGEDFARISVEVPSAFIMVGVGSIPEGHKYGMHHPKMFVNEEALMVGAAVYANTAHRWLDNN